MRLSGPMLPNGSGERPPAAFSSILLFDLRHLCLQLTFSGT